MNVASSTISNNMAMGGIGGNGIGGGIFDNGGSLVLSSSLLEGTWPWAAPGPAGKPVAMASAAVSLWGILGRNATATVTNTKFTNNVAMGGAGGSGANGGDGIGGAIAVAIDSIMGESDASSLSATGCLLTLNTAIGGNGGSGANGGNGYGGGAYVATGGSAVFQNTTINYNGAIGGLAGTGGSDGDGSGGGLFVAAGATVKLKKTTVSSNYASTSDANIDGTVTYL